jgi:hypothetical protein
MKVYLSGKITGLTEPEYTALFDKAADEVRALGFTPVNPVTLPHQHSKTWSAYMRESLIEMLKCEAIYMMSGWQDSRGSVIENNICRLLDFEIIQQQ